MKNKRIKIGAIIFSVLLVSIVSITFILRNDKNSSKNKSEIAKTDEVRDESNLENNDNSDKNDENNVKDETITDSEEKNSNEDNKDIDFSSLNDNKQDSSSKNNVSNDNTSTDSIVQDNNSKDSDQEATNNSNNSNNTESTKPEPVEKYVTISITCNTILNNLDKVPEGKKDIIPSNGVIMSEKKVEINDGDTVFDVLVRETRKQRIHMDFVESPVYNSAYIKGINNLYEFDGGELSGWMYSVNGVFPSYGCSQYELKAGDSIQWKYTCDLGRDL